MEKYLTPYQDYADESSLFCDTSSVAATPRSDAPSRFVSFDGPGDLEEGPLEEEEEECVEEPSRNEGRAASVAETEPPHPEMHLEMLKVEILRAVALKYRICASLPLTFRSFQRLSFAHVSALSISSERFGRALVTRLLFRVE